MNEQEKNEKTPTVFKKVGKVMYRVKVHFNEDSKENLQQKVERLIRDEIKGNKIDSQK